MLSLRPALENRHTTLSLLVSSISEARLPGQPYHDGQTSVNVTATGPGADVNQLSGTVVNGGNATAGEGWAATLKREMANRYFTSVLCSW